MKKTLSTIAMALLMVSAVAQTRSIENELASDPKRAYGTDYPYLYEMTALTPAPDGYKAFYISHYGRHGSRYYWEEALYNDIDTLLTTAHDRGVLTAAGEQFYHNFKSALPELKAGWGELTEVGWNQHKQIARTMYDRFPEVFTDGGHVDAICSLSGRCVMSMASFCLELKGCNPKLDIHEQSARSTLPGVVPGDRQNPQWRKFKRMAPRFWRSKERLTEDTTLVRTILGRMLTTTEGLKKSPRKTAEDLKNLYTSLPSIGKEGMMCGIYTDEDVVSQWEVSNLGSYAWVFGDQLNSVPILHDILKAADDVIEGRSSDIADLRFGHDSYIGPLTILMGINGADKDPENPSEVKYCYQNYETCKASNIQLVFYRNSKNDVLVKCLLNGAESVLPVPTDIYPYYKWSDFQKYYSNKYPSESNE